MNSLDRALGAFGETIGLDRPALGPGGNLALQLDSGRRVAIEAADTEVLVYVSDPVPYDAPTRLLQAWRRAHHSPWPAIRCRPPCATRTAFPGCWR